MAKQSKNNNNNNVESNFDDDGDDVVRLRGARLEGTQRQGREEE